MPICFSPLTTRLPLGSTSITVSVIVPVKVLSLPEVPPPSNSLLDVAQHRRALEALARQRPGSRAPRTWYRRLRVDVDADFLLAHDLFVDLHRQRVADPPRAPVLEQRLVGRLLEDRAVDRGRHGGDDRMRRHRLADLDDAPWRDAAGQHARRAARPANASATLRRTVRSDGAAACVVIVIPGLGRGSELRQPLQHLVGGLDRPWS